LARSPKSTAEVVSCKPKGFEKEKYLSANRLLRKRQIVKKGEKIGGG